MVNTFLSLFRFELTPDTILLETKWIVPLVAVLIMALAAKLKRSKK